MAEQIEQLTEEERRWLEADPEFQKWDVRRKVLRIIDAHAADRAALVARVEELERELKRVSGMLEHESELHMRALDLVVPHTHLTDAASKLDSERVESRVGQYEKLCESKDRSIALLESEVAALRAEVDMQRRRADHHQGAAEALRSDRADLVARAEAAERKAESWERGHDHAWGLKVAAESEVARLREALAAARRREDWEHQRNVVSEARVRELEARCEVLRRTSMVAELERQLAAAEALRADRAALVARVAELERNEAWLRKDRDTQVSNARADRAAAESELEALRAENERLREVCEALRAAADSAPDYQAALDALDTEHRLACEWKARYEAECVEHAVTRDRLEAANALTVIGPVEPGD